MFYSYKIVCETSHLSYNVHQKKGRLDTEINALPTS